MAHLVLKDIFRDIEKALKNVIVITFKKLHLLYEIFDEHNASEEFTICMLLLEISRWIWI